MDNQKRELNELFTKSVSTYLDNCTPTKLAINFKRGVPEFEIRFGINNKQSKPFIKIDYDHIVKELRINNWKTDSMDGSNMLRITPEFYDINIGAQIVHEGYNNGGNNGNNEDNNNGNNEANNNGNNNGGAFNRAQNKKQNVMRMSNIRAEIIGIDMIQKYCESNSLDVIKNMPTTSNMSNPVLKFTQKNPIKIGPNDTSYINFNDFNFRISSQYELDFPYTSENERIKKIQLDWTTSKKNFRCINRVRYYNPTDDNVVFVDISIIKNNKTYTTHDKKIIPIPALTIQEADVFNNPEHYEFELELNNDKITAMLSSNSYTLPELVQIVMKQLKNAIRTILSGLQETPYPCSYVEQEQILFNYMRRIHGNKWTMYGTDEISGQRSPFPYFLGPSPVTLQMENIMRPIELEQGVEISTININTNYCVTEKADGIRAILYVSPEGPYEGNIYLINNILKVIFTGSKTTEKKCYNSIIDGEYIAYGKHNVIKPFMHQFAAFDIYFMGNPKETYDILDHDKIRHLPFISNSTTFQLSVSDLVTVSDPVSVSESRLSILNDFINVLEPTMVMPVTSMSCKFKVRSKTFYVGNFLSHISTNTDNNKLDPNQNTQTIFDAAAIIWNRKDLFDYEIDGLIFTPTNTGVGGNRTNEASELKKMTWDRAFKWKPPKYNTIDFLVSVMKDKSGKDKISNKIIMNNVNNNNNNNISASISETVKYKTLILYCGFNSKRDKIMNPFYDVLHDNVQKLAKETDEAFGKIINTSNGGYQPVPFQPNNPYDDKACYCNVIIDKNDNYMRTVENDVFYEDMIVEFSYNNNINNSTEDNWVPLRVRYDKTSELRSTKNNFGNNFATANSNWRSIHNPITEDIIMGKIIPNQILLDNLVYYNRKDKDVLLTKSLRDFHNLYVKRHLIERTSIYIKHKLNVSTILLIDYAVGKAGDLSKWTHSPIDFVYGIDITGDNILNDNDGACVRYLSMRNKHQNQKLRAIFLQGNSGLNIRTTGAAFYSDQDKQISAAIFGNGTTSEKQQISTRFVGIGRDGFHLSSCQFAMHYLFKTPKTLHSFMRNLSECTRKNGYYVGTCYNGQRVFDLLANKLTGESITLCKIASNNVNKKIFEITKLYENNQFPNDDTCIGMPINVYQESIDNVIQEYLVNFTYFNKLMELYGFILAPVQECNAMGFSEPSGSFEILFNQMNKELRSKHLNINSISDYDTAQLLDGNEKIISFLNQYFVYKKNRDISNETIKLLYKKYVTDSDDNDNDNDNDEYLDNHDHTIKNTNITQCTKTNTRIILSISNYRPINEPEITNNINNINNSKSNDENIIKEPISLTKFNTTKKSNSPDINNIDFGNVELNNTFQNLSTKHKKDISVLTKELQIKKINQINTLMKNRNNNK